MAQQDATPNDAFSQLSVPATPNTASSPAPASQNDAFAKLSVPATPVAAAAAPPAEAPGVLARTWQGVKDFAAPVMELTKPPEGATEQVIHAAGGGGGALVAYRMAKGIVNSAENVLKAAPENYKQAVADYRRTVQDFHNSDYRNAISSAVSTAADASKIVNPLSSGPSNDMRELSEGARPGGDLARPLTRQALTAGTMLLGGEALAPEEEGAAAATQATSKMRVNPFRRAIASPEAAGEMAAQPIAKAGIAEVAPTVGKSLRSGIDVQTPFTEAKSLYQTVDKAAKTNFKDLYTKLDAAQDDARLAASGSAEEAKAQLNIKNTQDAIEDAKAIAAKSGVPDVDKTLAEADAKFTTAQANKDFNTKFFKPNVRGNATLKNAPETLDINGAIKSLEDMDAPNRFGISRAQQTSLGKDGVVKLKQYLYDAKAAGQKAVDARALRNTMLKWVTGAGAVGTMVDLAVK